jgi:hypothetical protein
MDVERPNIQSNFSLADVTLENAIEDLKVSRLLFRYKHYARSLFHIQQCVEKSVKSYGYYFKLFDEDIARKNQYIGHNTIKAYPLSLEQYQKIAKFLKSEQNNNIELKMLFKEIPFFNEIEMNVNTALDDFKEWFQSVDTNHSAKQLGGYLKILQKRSLEADEVLKLLKNKKYSKEIKEIVCEESKTTVIDQLQFQYRKAHKPFLPIRKKIDECFESFTQKKTDRLLLFNFYQYYSMESLLYLGLITQWHEQTTRYPNSKNSFNPLRFYAANHPLVINFRELSLYTNSSVQSLKKMYSMEIPRLESIFK